MITRNYTDEIQALSDELGHLVIWRTNQGDLNNQMYKLLGISRPSHVTYLKNNNSVPSYIWNQLSLLQMMKPFQRIKFGVEKLTSFDNLTIEKSLQLALSAWEELTGRKMDDDSGCDWAGHFSVRRANKTLLELKAQDPSLIAVGLSLDSKLSEFISEHHFSFSEFYTNDNTANREMAAYTQIRSFLDQGPLGNAIHTFKDTCTRAIKFYKPNAEIPDELISSSIDYMLNAKAAFKKYPKFQISGDAFPASNQQLKIQEQIFIFDSVSDLIEHSGSLPNGFSLSLIMAAQPTDSFFCMVAKADNNIYVLTDKPSYTEFAKKFYSGRNQRYNTNRYESTLMPYEMMNIEISDKGRTANMSDSTSLTVLENGLRVLGHFKEMSNEAILWFTFLLEECRNAFFSNNPLIVPALGYLDTSTVQHKLLRNVKSEKQLPSTYVTKGTVTLKSAKELSRANLESNTVETKRFKAKNGWMEKKYDHLIDESLLYVPEQVPDNILAIENQDTKVHELVIQDESNKGKELSSFIMRIPSTLIGTPEQIQAEVDLFARYNKANIITRLLRKDYNDRQTEVQTWISKKIKANLPNLVDDLVSLNHEKFFIGHRYLELKELGEVPSDPYEMHRQIHVAKMGDFYDYRAEVTPLQKILKMRRKNNTPRCAMTGYDFPEHTFYLNVSTILDLEIITGLSRDQFPIELQNWRCRSDLIAPLDSALYDPIESIKNPWWDMQFKFSILLSRDFVNQRRKELGVKGRFIRPLNYFDQDGDSMYQWLSKHELVKGQGLGGKSYSLRGAPRWSFFTYG